MADKNLIAYCGLYCGACRKYLIQKCSGCRTNPKLSWCKIKLCCETNKYFSCADCKEYSPTNDCKKFNNLVSKIIGYVFRSDRNACIKKIKTDGADKFAQDMEEKKTMTIRK
jgi:hypothetical protein